MSASDFRTDSEHTGRLELLLRVATLLGRTLDLSDVLQTSIDSAVEVTGLDTGAIYLLTDGNLFLGATTPQMGPDFPDELRHAVLSDHPHVKRAIDEQAVYFIERLDEARLAPAERAAAEARDLRSMLYVPLMADGVSLGVFMVGACGRTARMSAEDIDLCRTLSSTISLAVSNARLFDSLRAANVKLERAVQEELEHKEQLRALTNETTLAEERQRRELAVELHDRVTQPLAVLKMRLQEATRSFDGHPSYEEYRQSLMLLDEAIGEARSITAETSPPFIFDIGLAPALEWLCERAAARGVACEVFADDGLEDAPEDVRLFAFQAVRELLANSMKHSGAQHITVTLDRMGDDLKLRVTDDGGGFPTSELPSGPAHDRGFGLFSLRERATHLGGALEVASSLGAGTIVSLRVPLHATP